MSRHLVTALTIIWCAGGCGSGSPTGSSGSPTGVVTVASSPTQVAWSGVPSIGTACAGFANTWYWTDVFTETAGVSVSLTSRTPVRDGATQPDVAIAISVPARGSFTNHMVYCGPNATQHTVQNTFHGTDANGHSITVVGPMLTMLAKP